MKLPVEVRNKRNEFINKFPFPKTTNEDEFRLYMGRLIQQLVFSFPNNHYGWKSAGGGRPPSKDLMAANLPEGLIGWDMFSGVGTGNPTLNDDPDSQSIAGQQFIPVEGKDFLGDTGDGGENGELPINEKILKTLEEIRDDQRVQTTALAEGLASIRQAVKDGVKVKF